MNETASSVDPAEIARFAAMAEEWWDPTGKFRPLHRFNPVRLGWIRDQIVGHFGRDARDLRPFEGLAILDIGCGGGLVAEPMARLGARVTGIDAAQRNVEIARTHAASGGLEIDYRWTDAETLASEGGRYDVVLALEIVEHVADLGVFVRACERLLAPGGMMVVATLNRTPQAFALAIVGAEYVLRWLPRGTHQWRKFVRPSELAAALREAGMVVRRFAGATYGPLSDTWRITDDVAVNYLALATR